MPTNQEVINQWSISAPYWEKHREMIRQMFVPVTQALVEDAQISSGHTVLDIATGSGEPALSVAALVAPEGRVIGIDPVPGMVAAASRAADKMGLGNAQFEVASVDRLPFVEGSFDAAISRFGAMFFPSPVDALRELLRVLKPGRKLALAVWHTAETNPFFDTLSQVVERHIASPPREPDSPDTFRFASPGKLRGLLTEAGAVAPSERLLRFNIHAPISAEGFWTLRCEISDTLRDRLAALPSEQLTEVRAQVLEAVREYSLDGGMNFPSEVLIVSGTR